MLKPIILIVLLLSSLNVFAQESLDAILIRLDHLIENRDQYITQRQQEIESLYRLKDQADGIVEHYSYARRLHGLFLPYHIDSAMHYANECLELARKHPQKTTKEDAQLILAQSYLLAGMYYEAGELLTQLSTQHLSNELKQFYYTLQNTRYRYLHSYLVGSDLNAHYDSLSKIYQDSLIQITEPTDARYPLAYAEKLRDAGQYEESKQQLKLLLSNLTPEDRSFAYTAYTLSTVYEKEKDVNDQMKYLGLSAESDIRNAVRENAAIRELALLLYRSGDIKRAYNYIKVALDDALFSKARLRSFEILQILPVIDQSYQQMREQKRLNMLYFTVIASLLSLFLLVSLFYNQRQKRKLKWANDEINVKNEQLKDANEQLKLRNDQIRDVNIQLSSSNQIQEEYIGKYLKLCSTYIGKLDHYRQTIHKKAAMGSKEELLKLLKSKEMVDQELQTFYHDFDEAFLELYPGFVEQFNALLKEDEQILLKPDEKLNTELRIFALIRLGITESPQIAKFLRYSVTTIYNYRTKVRNKARVPRDLFEDEVMKLGNPA